MISSDSPDNVIKEFPCSMFFSPADGEKTPLRLRKVLVYNRSHRFSQWLIKNRDALEAYANGLFNEIIDKMLWIHSDFITDINAILTQLRTFRNNYFNITDELLLNENDIADYEEDDET